MLAVLLAALESDTDRQKFIEIYEKYHVQMERTAMRILKEQSDVEDAVQNAFMQMIRHFEKIFEIPCEELPFWIISIVKNEARAILRKNRRTVSLEDWDGFAEHIDDISGYTELVDLFTQLPKTYRSVLELKMLHGYTDILQCSMPLTFKRRRIKPQRRMPADRPAGRNLPLHT